MVCWLCPSLSFPPASKVVVVGVCLFVFSRDSVVKCTCDAVLGRGGRPYNSVHFQSGSELRFGGKEEGVLVVWESSSQST